MELPVRITPKVLSNYRRTDIITLGSKPERRAEYQRCGLLIDSQAGIYQLLRGGNLEEYRAAGSPYGDDDQGSIASLLAKPRLTPSA